MISFHFRASKKWSDHFSPHTFHQISSTRGTWRRNGPKCWVPCWTYTAHCAISSHRRLLHIHMASVCLTGVGEGAGIVRGRGSISKCALVPARRGSEVRGRMVSFSAGDIRRFFGNAKKSEPVDPFRAPFSRLLIQGLWWSLWSNLFTENQES